MKLRLTKILLISVIFSVFFTLLTKYIVNYYSDMHRDIWDLADLAISIFPPVIYLLVDKKASIWSAMRVSSLYAAMITLLSYYFN